MNHGVDRSLLTATPVRRTLFLLAMPILGEQLLNTFVGIFDVFLAGRFGAAATAAVGLAAYVTWLAQMLMMLVGTGTTAVVARFEGAGDHEQANRYANQSLSLAAILGVLCFALLFFLAPAFARYTNMTGESARIVVEYLRIDAVGNMFMSLTLVGCAALRGVGNMRTPMLVFGAINIVNVAVSCVMVFGLGPFPELGVTGIVVGTVVAHIVGAVLIVIVLMKGRCGIKLVPRDLPIRRALAWRVLRIGGPAAADGAILWSGHFAFLAIIARLAEPPLGEAYLAAHMIAVRVEALTYLPATAWANATATMIGQALGAGRKERARRCGHEGVLQCGLLALGITILFFFGAEAIYDLMSTDPRVHEIGVGPFRVLSLFQVFMVISIVYVGGMRGAGDTRFPLLITCVGVVVRLSIGVYGGWILQGGLLGAWMGMFADQLWRATAGAWRFASGKWMHTKV